MYEKITANGMTIARGELEPGSIACAGDALDAIMSANYEVGAHRVILNKSAFNEDFFVLSTGLAGEILQKFVNYRMRLAIVGDFGHYTSKPLKDFIRESNRGNHIGFVSTVEQAIEWLSKP